MTRHKTESWEVRSQPNELGWASFQVERGERVVVGEGVIAFEWLDFTVELHNLLDHTYTVAGRLSLDDPPSRYILDEFTLRRARFRGEPSKYPVTALAVRSVPVDRIISEVAASRGIEADEVDSIDVEAAAELRQAGLADAEALRFAASKYLAASLRSQPTAEAIADAFDCSVATAGRWIAAAKDAGFLKVADTRRR